MNAALAHDLQRVLTASTTLPPAVYTEPDFFAWEFAELLPGAWHCVGRHDELPGAGDYRCFDLCGTPLALVRGAHGVLRCLSTACRHRAMPVLEGSGNCARLRCPFHGWTYRLDGSLAGAPGMQRAPGFVREEHALAQLPLHQADGFVFVNLDRAAPAPALDEVLALHAPWRLAQMRLTRRRQVQVACNWKLFIQVFMEYYHLANVHANTFAATAFQAPGAGDETFSAGFASVFGEHQGTSAVLQGTAAATFPPVAGLDARLARGTRYTHLFPALAFAVTRDCMWLFECYPLAPGETLIYVDSCFPASTVERDDFEQLAAGYYARWDLALAEDLAVLERQQLGMRSRLARPGRGNRLESAVIHFERWLARQAAPARSVQNL